LKTELWKFGLQTSAALAVLGALSYFFLHRQRASVVLVSAAFLFLVFGLVLPTALSPIHRGLLRVGHILGWVNTRVLLGVIYYLLLTPIGFITRSTGKNPIRRGPGRWKRCDRSGDPVRDLEKQF
jgi:hypothetical protein